MLINCKFGAPFYYLTNILYMRYKFLLLAMLCIAEWTSAQVVNRYPVIQRPTQTSATIAWRRATAAVGTLYLGSASGVWSDSVSTSGPEQKPYFDLVGLQPNVRYYYQVKSIAANDTFVSAIESFFTAPVGSIDDISFLAYGDCGYNNSTQHTVKNLMQTETVDFAIVTGDVDQGVGDAYDNVFFGVYKDMLKKNCHFTCIGNHDTYADGAATYLDAFYLPSNNPQNSERYYSFEWGDSKFICMDANISYAVGSAQYNWMLNELRCNDKKWLFVFFHQPPWTNAWSADYYLPFSPYFLYQGNTDMRTILVPEFERYDVDFVVNGHAHCYQRGSLNGVQYLITGGAGASTLDANKTSAAPNISVEIYQNHYVRFDISGDTAKYVMINSNGQRMDSVMVVKPYAHYSQTLNNSDASCFGFADAQISLNVTGPANRSPYTFQWNNGQTTPNLSGLAAGQYNVIIRDALGCERLDTVVIEEPVQVLTQIVSPTATFTVCDGSPLSIEATGGHSAYLWSTGATTSSIQVTNAGNYSVTAYDATGCASPVATAQVFAATAPDSSTIQYQVNGLQLSISNSGSAFYSWNFGDGSSSTALAPTHTYASAGQYMVQVIVMNACGVDTFYYNITVNPVAVEPLAMQEELQVTVQPNPFKEMAILKFKNPKAELFNLTISDLNGRILKTYSNISGEMVQIDKAGLVPGTYFYTLSNKRLKSSGKLVVE